MSLTEEPEVTQIEIPLKWSVCTIRGLKIKEDGGFSVTLAFQLGAQVDNPEPGTYHIKEVSDPASFRDFLISCKSLQPGAEIIFDETGLQVFKRICRNVFDQIRNTLGYHT